MALLSNGAEAGKGPPEIVEAHRLLQEATELNFVGNGEGVDTPIGRVPAPTAIDTSGLDIDAETITKLVSVDAESWRQEVPQIEAHYASIGERLPDELKDELRELEKRLAN